MSEKFKKAIGLQSPSDNIFTKKARLLQSCYRVNTLKQTKCGVGPNKNSVHKLKDDKGQLTGEVIPSYYGNILADGDKSGLNFLHPIIFDYVKSRIQFLKNGETINEYRIFNNMLSSQPMCFNLFYPIKSLFEQNEKAATKILKSCFPNLNIKTIFAIEIEFLPYPTHIYLDDKTAFDAMIVYQTESDEKNILAIETKYVEKLGDNPSSKLEKQIDLVKNSPIFSDAGKKACEKGFGQLGRNFLLAEKYKIENRLDKAYAVTISPSENDSSKAEITEFYKMMNPKYHDRLFYKSLEEIVDCIKETSPKNMNTWINDFQKRYLGFDEMDNLFKEYKKA